MLGTIIGCNFCLMSLLKMLCLLFCLRVGVDPEEEDRKSAYVSVSIVGFVIRNMEGIFFPGNFCASQRAISVQSPVHSGNSC